MFPDYSAASKPYKPKAPIVALPAVPDDSAPTDTPDGLNLHAFTHCPDCRAIIHRESGCPACLTGVYAPKE